MRPWLSPRVAHQATRVLRLGAPVLWLCLAAYPEMLQYDEAFSVVVARLPWARLWAATAGDVHPPLYYALLKVWLWLWADSGLPIEMTARLLSVLCSVAALGMLAAWLKLLRVAPGRREVTLLLTAWLPGVAFYAAEARMYALLTLEVLAAGYALWRARRQADLPSHLLWLTLAGLALGAAALTHNVGLLYAATLAGAYWLAARGSYGPAVWSELFVVAGVAIVTWSPWAPVFMRQLQATRAGYWTRPPTLDSLAYNALRAIIPAMPRVPAWESALLLLVAGLTTWSLLAALTQNRLALLALAVGVAGLALLLSYLGGTGLVLHRLFVPALPFLALVWAGVLTRPGYGRALRRLTLAGLLLLNGGYLTQGRHAQTWSELLALELQPGDVAYGLGAMSVPLALYRPDVPFYVVPATGTAGTGLSAATLDALGARQARLEDVSWSRAWVFTYDQLPLLDGATQAYLSALPTRYTSRAMAHGESALLGVPLVEGGLWLLENNLTSLPR